MLSQEFFTITPLFYLFIAFTFLLSLGFIWGRKTNQKIAFAVLQDLVDIVKPDDKTFTNIGGIIGYHAQLWIKRKNPVPQVDATITLLPRQSWLYFPISKIIMRFDRLFITVYLQEKPPAEGHLIERGYARFRGPKIQNAQRLGREDCIWGKYTFWLYFENSGVRENLRRFVQEHPDPGTLRHIAIVPEQKRAFIFMIPRRGQVSEHLAPAYRWILSTLPGRRES